MKTIIALTVLLNLTAVSAQVAHPGYYSADWKITKVSPMCPNDIPSGAVCFGLGSIVNVEAKIGCGDTVISKHFDVLDTNVIEAQSVVKANPYVRCAGQKKIKDVVLVHNPGPVSLENIILEFMN